MTMNGQLTDTEARRLSGDGETTPPEHGLSSTSEGDLRKGSYRRSEWPRLSTQAVVNDDGTSLSATTDALLAQMLTVMEQIVGTLQKMEERGNVLEKYIIENQWDIPRA